MTRRILAALTCWAFLLSLAPSLALARPAPARAAPAPTTGSLSLICLVDGAEYVIDEGRDSAIRGVTPIKVPIRLKPGPHTIRVSKEGYLPYSEVFDIAAGSTSEVEADLVLYSGTLKILATPAGVQVQVDGKVLGAAPVEASVSIGEHVVRLTHPGYVEEVRRAHVKTSQVTEIAVRMVPEAEAQKAASGSSFWKQWWFWTIIGGVVAGAVATGVAVPLTQDQDQPARENAKINLW